MTRTDVTEIPVDKRREILESHEDTTHVTVGDLEIPVFLGGASFDFADKHDIDLSTILQEMMQGDEDPRKNIEAVVSILYVGTLPFGTDVDPAEIKLRLSLQGIEEVVEQIFPEVEALAEEETAGKGLTSQENGSAGTAMKSARSRGGSSPSPS